MDFDDVYFCMMQSKSLKILHHIKVQINISFCQKEVNIYFVELPSFSIIQSKICNHISKVIPPAGATEIRCFHEQGLKMKLWYLEF
jgi:hypothetical protein